MDSPQRLALLTATLSALLLACAGSPPARPEPTAVPAAVATSIPPTVAPTHAPKPALAPPSAGSAPESLRVSRSGWKTDFSKATVPLGEIQSGGPPRDGIPPIDRPRFIAPGEAAEWLKDVEPVVVYEESGDARAYPLQVLIWHEIVNDTVGGRPVAVTFCPLCNTAIAFDRRLDGVTYDFGTTGNLRYSDLVMWDRQTESWWQQITGEAIVGELAGKRLTPVPAVIASFAQFRAAHPDGKVLSRETGFSRAYGRNPYVGYDDVTSSPFLYVGPSDGRLRPMERVVTVSLNGEDAAYPFSLLEQHGAVHDAVGGRPIVVLHRKGTASALDQGSIPASRDVGSTAVFEPVAAGHALTFRLAGDRLVDAETGSEWNVLGQATAGPLAGQRLTPIVSGTHFWFAWAAFKPQTRVWSP